MNRDISRPDLLGAEIPDYVQRDSINSALITIRQFVDGGGRLTDEQTRELRLVLARQETLQAPGSAGVSEIRDSEPLPQVLRQIVDDYNNPDAINNFRQKYEPMRVEVSNAIERLRSGGLSNGPAPIFQESDAGEYFFIPVRENDRDTGRFAAMPRFNLTYQAAQNGPGAMGEVFDVEGFDPRRRSDNIELLRPALFRKGSTGSFKLIEKGKIKLKPVKR